MRQRSTPRCGMALLAGLAGGSWAQDARAQPQPPVPPQDAVCVASRGGRIVDKERLARFLLRNHPVNVLAVEDRLGIASGAPSISRRVLATRGLCDGNAACSNADKASLEAIRGFYAQMAAGSITGYRPTAAVAPDVWFAGPNEQAAITCTEDAGGRPVEVPGSRVAQPATPTTPFRIRGKVDDLHVDRSSTAAFRNRPRPC